LTQTENILNLESPDILTEMDKKVINSFVRDFGSLIILWILNKKRLYGNAIINKINKFYPNKDRKIRGSCRIYPMLHDLEDNGLIEGIWETRGRQQIKYYEITAKGRNELLIVQKNFKTEIKNAEEALKECEEKYKTLFEFNPNYTILVGRNGVLLDVNVATEQMINISKDELIGKSFSELAIFPKEDLDLHGEMFSRILTQKNVAPYRSRVIAKDGKIRWVLNQTTAIMKDDKLNYVLVIGRDITEYKKAEDKLKENAERFSAVAESAVDAIVTTDANGTIIFFNPSLTKIFGYKKEEMKGKPLTILMPERFKKQYLDELQKFKKHGKHRLMGKIVTTTGLKKDKKEFSFEMSLTTWKSKGKPYFTSIIRDLTERQKADEQIKKSLQEKEVLLREIHHRVKNNMQIISSLLNLQIQYEILDETVGVLKESHGRVKSMVMIHEKLYQSDSFSKINFKEFLPNLVSDIFYSYGIKTGTIGRELDIEDVNIGIDTAIPLGLIINELVTNSVKHAFPQSEGTINIKLKSLPEQMVLIISDDGIGLPKNLNIEKTNTLGLQLVNSLVKQIDGEVEICRNNGTEFKITFKELNYKERV